MTYVICGAAGKVGRATVDSLLMSGAKVRAVRHTSCSAALAERPGCGVVVADMLDPVALGDAMSDATAVQLICPLPPKAPNMRAYVSRYLDSVGAALSARRPPLVLFVSDYGAHIDGDTGLPGLFRTIERRLAEICDRLIVLRSAEHMENFVRLGAHAARTQTLPSMHVPLDVPFPMVSARDVGDISAELLLEAAAEPGAPLVMHCEGPRRYSVHDVSIAMGQVLGRAISAFAIPEAEWLAGLLRAGLSASYAEAVTTFYRTANAGLIDREPGAQVRFGTTALAQALARQMFIDGPGGRAPGGD